MDKSSGFLKNAHTLIYTDFAQMQRKYLIKKVNVHLIKIGVLFLEAADTCLCKGKLRGRFAIMVFDAIVPKVTTTTSRGRE